MKTWNAPEIQELDVKLTASSGDPGPSEKNGGFENDVWHNANYDSTVYELGPSGDCVVKKKDSQES